MISAAATLGEQSGPARIQAKGPRHFHTGQRCKDCISFFDLHRFFMPSSVALQKRSCLSRHLMRHYEWISAC
jgi:hypothetical protein